MENQELATPASEETVEVAETTVEETTEEVATDDVETLKAALAKAKEYGKNQKIRAEKAETSAKDAPASDKVELTQSDVLAIARSDVHDDDIERITKFAQMEGISIKDALANDDMKAILDRRVESRKVAQATNTNNSPSSPQGVTGEALLNDAKAGKLPDPKHLEAMWDAENGK